jgi:hypothetical protein
LKYSKPERAITLTSVPPRRFARAAAVHRGVADADDQHALADRLDVAEVNRLEPLDADVDVDRASCGPGSRAPCRAARRCRRTPRRTPSPSSAFRLSTGVSVADIDAHVEDVADLLVEHLLGQAEGGDVDAHQPAGRGGFSKIGDTRSRAASGRCHRERGRAGADERDALAVLLRGALGAAVLTSSL